MKNIRILHLAIDDKFVDHAFLVFEKAFPEQNDVLVIAKSEYLEFVKLEPKRVVLLKHTRRRMPKNPESLYQNYDLVIFHSFSGALYPEIYNIPQHVPTVWLGWGYDYYDLIALPEHHLLPETCKLTAQFRRSNARANVGKMLRFCFELLGMSKSRKKAIEKLSIFSPVLPNEYSLVQQAKSWKKFPESARWNYGTIEDHLIKGFEREQVDGNAILIGNSASLTCNHTETFRFLKESGLKGRSIVAPLSYGDKRYGQKIAEVGEQYFGKNFDPLMDFMPVQDYVATIKKCGYVIMNHKRQQAVGNIVIMLYLGARVFLREENPTYPFLKEMGVSLSSVQELERDPSLLDTPPSTEECETNRKLVSDYWSRERGIVRTKALVGQALEHRCVRAVVSN